MIVLDFVDHLLPLVPATATTTRAITMEGKTSGQNWPPLSPPPTSVDSPPDTDSARSTPEAGAEPKGAIPKSRSIGKLDAIRSSLREVGKNSSFKLGRKKQGEDNPKEGAKDGSKEDKKKTKKSKKKAAVVVASPDAITAVAPPAIAASPPNVTGSSESLPTKPSKVSKATSLVRKLSIGRYRGGKSNPKDAAQARTLSPTSTSPELSPAASRTDVSEDEAQSVASSNSESRQGPEGEDGVATGDATPSPSASPPSSAAAAVTAAADVATSPPPTKTSPPPPTPHQHQPPPPAAGLGQSRLIAGGANKGLAGRSQPPSPRVPAATTTAASAASPPRQSFESHAPRKDRDPALETVPEAHSHEEAQAATTAATQQQKPPPPPSQSVEAERSPPASAFHSAFASLDEASPPPRQPQEHGATGSSRAASAAFMSQRLASAAASSAADVATTKSQILSITTPALKKQQAIEEIRVAAAVAASSSVPAPATTPAPAPAPAPASAPDPDPSPSPSPAPAVKPSTSSAPPPPPTLVTVHPQLDDPEDDQFGDLDDYDEYGAVKSRERQAMSAPPPSAASVMAEARARLSQSLSGTSEAVTQPVNEKREHLYKILVIGELGTGKTSIIKRYVHQFFSQHYRATIGVDFALKVLNWDANTVIRLQLWDIAGQERFGNMTRVYYKEAVGAFIVFDVTRAATFDAVIKWKQDLDAKVQLADGSPIPCVLLANKCDQQKEGIVNNSAKMDEYCKEKGFSAWFETSAKENINIEDAARCLVTKILQNDKLIHNENGKDTDKFALDGKAQKDEKSGGKSCAC